MNKQLIVFVICVISCSCCLSFGTFNPLAGKLLATESWRKLIMKEGDLILLIIELTLNDIKQKTFSNSILKKDFPLLFILDLSEERAKWFGILSTASLQMTFFPLSLSPSLSIDFEYFISARRKNRIGMKSL